MSQEQLLQMDYSRAMPIQDYPSFTHVRFVHIRPAPDWTTFDTRSSVEAFRARILELSKADNVQDADVLEGSETSFFWYSPDEVVFMYSLPVRDHLAIVVGDSTRDKDVAPDICTMKRAPFIFWPDGHVNVNPFILYTLRPLPTAIPAESRNLPVPTRPLPIPYEERIPLERIRVEELALKEEQAVARGEDPYKLPRYLADPTYHLSFRPPSSIPSLQPLERAMPSASLLGSSSSSLPSTQTSTFGVPDGTASVTPRNPGDPEYLKRKRSADELEEDSKRQRHDNLGTSGTLDTTIVAESSLHASGAIAEETRPTTVPASVVGQAAPVRLTKTMAKLEGKDVAVWELYDSD